MQFDDQQNVDPTGQDASFDPSGQGNDQVSDTTSDEYGNNIPGTRQYADQPAQASEQGDLLQGQNPEDLDVGGQGSLPGDTSGQPGPFSTDQPGGARADAGDRAKRDDSDAPYGNVDDIVADYGNTQSDQGQQGISNV